MPDLHQPTGHPHQHLLPDGRHVALGRPRVRRDPRMPKMVRYVDLSALGPPPDTLNFSHLTPNPGMFANDRIGDCTRAAQAHVVMLHTALVGNMVTPSDSEVIAAYSRTSGYDPATGTNDNGDDELNVMADWKANSLHGVGLHAAAQVDVNNLDHVRLGMQFFAGLYIGVALPISAQAQTGYLWDAADGYQGEPGSWGGHAVNVVDIDWTSNPHTLTVVTWGTFQKMTEAFWLKYVDESYACVTSAWAQSNPDKVDLAQLDADMLEVGRAV